MICNFMHSDGVSMAGDTRVSMPSDTSVSVARILWYVIYAYRHNTTCHIFPKYATYILFRIHLH